MTASRRRVGISDWLFTIGAGGQPVDMPGLIPVAGYAPHGRRPSEVSAIETAASYGAHSVFFGSAQPGHEPIAQAFIFSGNAASDDAAFAQLHKRLWSWGGVPLVYRALPGQIQLFRCAHRPDFVGHGEQPVCHPIDTLKLGAEIAAQKAWWDGNRLQSGTIWDDPAICKRIMSAGDAAHRTLVNRVAELKTLLSGVPTISADLCRRLLILALLIAYLEERDVLVPEDFAAVKAGAQTFFDVLPDGPALVSLLKTLEKRFNGHVFELSLEQQETLRTTRGLGEFARRLEGREEANGQLTLWRLYSFRDLPVELISNIYQLFVKKDEGSVYTPPALVRLILEQAMSWDRLDRMTASCGVVMDPSCGSGVFVVEAYKRLVLHWRYRNGWARPDLDTLRSLLERVHGIDLEKGAVELAAFSLCLTLCDFLDPQTIRESKRLFPTLGGNTLHHGCFFDVIEDNSLKAPVSILVGNPPFNSKMTTSGAKRRAAHYAAMHEGIPDNQIAYLFLHEAMNLVAADGILAMIEPSGFLYNRNVESFRRSFFKKWNVREVLDFMSIRNMFGADTKVVVVVAEVDRATADQSLLHAVFRRSGRAAAEQGFDIDHYDFHWVSRADALESKTIWRANLFGGVGVKDLIDRLRTYPKLSHYAEKNDWDFGEGFLSDKEGDPADHISGKPILPASGLHASGLDETKIDKNGVPRVSRARSAERFTPPFVLIKKQEDLAHALWEGDYLTYKSEIVGLVAPRADTEKLKQVEAWLSKEKDVLKAYVAATSPRMFGQRATALATGDIFDLPFPKDGDLSISPNEKIIADDIVDYQRDFIRLGDEARVMKIATVDAYRCFDEVMTRQINVVYSNYPLRQIARASWPGASCAVYCFGEGIADWSGENGLQEKMEHLLLERKRSGLNITRIVRVYEKSFIYLLKPDRLRFWTRSIALRDADDILSDMRSQGF